MGLLEVGCPLSLSAWENRAIFQEKIQGGIGKNYIHMVLIPFIPVKGLE